MAVPAGAPFDHIVTIMMENQALCSVYTGCGGSGTYESQLADQNVLAMTWGTIAHNSEPNYIALFGAINDGSTSGDGVCCYFETGQNLVDKMEGAGLSWTAFAEDAGNSGTCSFSPPRSGDHFGFIDFSDMNTAARCSHFLTTASSSDPEFLAALNTPSPANFIWLTPNDNNNGHDSGVSGGDSYLAALVPKILASTEFTSTKATLLILYDEGYNQCSNTGGTGECVYASFSGPAAKKGVQISPAGASHYSYLSMIEAAWGLPSINSNDAGAPNMLSAFTAACTTNCPPPPLSTSFTSSPSTPLVNVPVTFTATTTGGKAPYIVSWNFGDGASGTGASMTHIYASVGSLTVTETATDSSSPSQTASSSKTLTIGTPQPLSTSFTLLPTSPSVNSPIAFTAVTTGGTAPYSNSWTFGDGGTATGPAVTHIYTSAQSFTITEIATDSSSPQQSATSSQVVTVASSLTGNFGVCTNLPLGWNCGNLHTSAPSPSSAQIVNGVFQSQQSNPGLGGSNDYYYSTTQKGTFPWTPCSAPASGVLPPGITSVSVNFTSLSYNPGSSPGSDRYHIYIALYYWLPNGPVTGGGATYQCLDTQVRVENIGGAFSPIGSTATYNPGDSFGWDQVTLQTTPGQSGLLVASVADQCLQDLQAWGLPTNTPCQLAGIEIGTEGYQFQELDVNWYHVNLNIGPIPLSTGFTFQPASPIVSTPVTFTATTTGGTAPYSITWNFGDGSSGTGVSIVHTFANAQSFTVAETATDSSSPSRVASSSKTLTVQPTPPLSTSFTFLPTTPLVNSLVTFTAVTIGGRLPYSIIWNFGDGTTGSGTSATHMYATAGPFTVTETATDSSTPTKTATDTHSVTIYTTLPISLTAFQASSYSPQVGQTVTFSASAAGGTTPYTYTVAFGDGGTGSGNPVTHTYSTAGSYTATVTVTDSASSQASVSRSLTVNVRALIPPQLTLPSNQTVTAGTWINFTVTATAVNMGGVVTLSVTGLPTGATFDPRTGLFSWKPNSSETGSYTVTFIGTDSSSPSTPTSKPMGIQVNQAAPSGSNGGNGGSGGGSNGSCSFCGIFPRISTTMSLLLIGGFIGLLASLALLTIRARATLEQTRRRMKRLNRDS